MSDIQVLPEVLKKDGTATEALCTAGSADSTWVAFSVDGFPLLDYMQQHPEYTYAVVVTNPGKKEV